ncbi:hypothetical protein BDZ91DRAFT_660265, partial [Kalaharituber pfeilii]
PRGAPPQEQQRIHNPTVDQSRVVKRPIPEARNTRQFQLTQLQRRFRFKGDDGTLNANTEFTINLTPSDPEFPYDVDVLSFVLTVPLGYAGQQPDADEDNRPNIRVLNDDIPVGFRINIENGFKDIVMKASRGMSLLDMINTLDKRLESFLCAGKAPTIKIIPNASSKATAGVGTIVNAAPVMELSAGSPPKAIELPLLSYTPEELSAAAVKREQDVRQLEARLGRSDIFRKTEAPNGDLIYTVPLEPRRKDLLPVPLLTIRSVILRVPKFFNLQPCVIQITNATRDVSELVEKRFLKQVTENPKWSLMAHLNALAANIHTMATEAMEEESEKATEAGKKKQQENEEKKLVQDLENKAIEHIVVIPRPPEWSYVNDGEEDSESDTIDTSDYEGQLDNENGEKRDETDTGSTSQARERGTALSFPGIQMPGVQLLEVLVLNITVKCAKCKTAVDIMQLRPGGKPRFDRCEKCSSVFGVGFRMEPVHQFSNRAGFFDLAGCTITEILPSNFLPHCASCDTALPPSGIANLVPGQTVSTNCRHCHSKMSLLIPEMKLLRVSQDNDAWEILFSAPGPTKKDERFVAGTELPDRGRCGHYRKSTRWFRFSCCLKVYPCDKCHDEAQALLTSQLAHPAEHANRIICGRCSREQNYRPNDCAYCGHEFLRKGRGYWEGGKGTRDKRLLRRNDPRKYKRVKKPVPEKEK